MIQDRVMRSPERTVGLLVTEKHTRTCPLVSQLRHLTVEIFLYCDKIMLEYCHIYCLPYTGCPKKKGEVGSRPN